MTVLFDFIRWQISKRNFWLIFPAIMLLFASITVMGALTDGMVGYYSFDVNCSINDYNSAYPASPTAGVESTNASAKIGKSCFFTSGEFDMIIMNNVASSLSNSNYTFSIWASRGSMTSYKGILGWGKSQYSYKVQYRSDNKVQTAMERQTSPYEDNIVISSQAYSTDFVHMVVSFTNEGKIKQVYINGTFIGSDEGQSVDTSSMTELFLGGVWAGTGSANHYDGYLDEFGFWNRELSSSEISQLYNSGSGLNPLTNVTPPVVNTTIVYNGKVPSDLNTGNVFGIVNISYNVTAGTYPVLNNTLYYRINDSTTNKLIYFNQTSISTYLPFPASYNISNSYFFQLKDNNYLPAIYEFDERKMENTVHSYLTLTGATNRWRCLFHNVSQIVAPFGFYEGYINKTAGGVGNGYNLYFVNSSGTAGLFYDTNINPALNHTHNQSKHNVYSLPYSTATNTIGGSGVTNIAYIEGRIESSVSVELGYIADTQGNCEYSTDSGGTWTTFGYLDNHLHFFGNTTKLNYYETSCTTESCKSSSETSDLIELTGNLPPSSPQIISPLGINYPINVTVPFNWTLGVSPNEYAVSTFQTAIYLENNTLYDANISLSSFTYLFNDTGYFYFEVINCDTNGLCSSGFSELFNVTPQVPDTPIVPPVVSNVTTININLTGIENALNNNGFRSEIYIFVLLGIVFLIAGIVLEPVLTAISGLFFVWIGIYAMYQGNLSESASTALYYYGAFWFMLIIGIALIILGIVLKIQRHISNAGDNDFYSKVNKKY